MVRLSIGISVAEVQVSSHTAYSKRILATEKRESANIDAYSWRRYVPGFGMQNPSIL